MEMGHNRRMKFSRPVYLVIAALFILTTLLVAGVEIAKAGPGLPGHWHGTPDPDACNSNHDCIYIFTICYKGGTQTMGSSSPSPLQHQVLVDLIDADFGACIHPINNSGRCKLTDIDSKIYIGQTFTATWLGRINNLRFRNADGVVFVSPLPGSGYFADGKANALFSLSDPAFGLLVAPGTYQVSCFGESGTVGGEIKVTISK
jgi:hypothetical protein